MQLGLSNNVTPSYAMIDTTDRFMEMRVASRLAEVKSGAGFDRQFMRAEVIMHEHMLHDLMAFQSQASGATLQLVNQTIPEVQKHLRDAQTILFEVSSDKADLGPIPRDFP